MDAGRQKKLKISTTKEEEEGLGKRRKVPKATAD